MFEHADPLGALVASFAPTVAMGSHCVVCGRHSVVGLQVVVVGLHVVVVGGLQTVVSGAHAVVPGRVAGGQTVVSFETVVLGHSVSVTSVYVTHSEVVGAQ